MYRKYQDLSAVTLSKAVSKINLLFLLCLAFTSLNSQTYTFTTAGVTGTSGPSQSQVNTAYASTNLSGSVSVSGGIQTFTIPTTGIYRIEARGAKGGDGYAPTGGSGAKMQGDFYLLGGQVLKILVGQEGGNGTVGGGGGASFVTTNSNVPLCIAGGGGGSANLFMYSYGSAYATGTTGLSGLYGVNGNYSITAGAGGLSANGGGTVISSSYTLGVGSGGGGLLTSGKNGSITTGGGSSYISGGAGGPGASSTVGIGGDGGFGGGGGGDWSNSTGGGGGGGYSGGGGGVHFGWGGGGGSYNNGSNQVNVSGFNSGSGVVIISRILSGVAIIQTTPLGCNSSSNAVLSATPVGGTPPYTYSWSPGGSTLSTLSGLGAGTYTCKVTDAASGTVSAYYVVTSPGSLQASIATQSNVTCAGGSNGSVTLTLSGGTAPFSYTWSPSGGTGSSSTSSVIGTGFSAGAYTCNINDANNCATSATTSISQSTTVLNVGGYAGPASVCLGKALSLIGTGAVTYTWTGGVINGTPFYPTSSGSYTVTGFDAAGCTGTAVASLSVLPLPALTINTINPVCSGTSVTLTASGANTYTWNGSIVVSSLVVSPAITANYTVAGTGVNGCTNTAVRTVSINTSPTVTANASTLSVCGGNTVVLFGSGANTYTWTGGVSNNVAFIPTTTNTYSVTGTNACGTSSSAITVSVSPQPQLSTNVSSTQLCYGNTLTLNASGASSYTWSGGVSNGVAFAPTSSSTFTLTGSNSCGTATTAVSITVNTLPIITASATNTNVCLGGTTALQGSGAVTYTWSGGVTNGIAFSPTSTSNYSVVGTDANGCQNSASKTISVGTLPVLTTTVTNPVVCFGSTVMLSGSGAGTYTWSGGVINNTAFTPSATNTYTLSGSNSCGTSTTVASVTVNTLPNVGVNAINPAVCAGGTCVLQGTGAVSYIWTGGISNNVAFAPSVSGTYFVIGTDANGCQNSASKTITVNPLPLVTASASNTLICSGSTVTLNGAGATTYTWTGGVINNVAFAPSTTTTYTLIGTDVNTCTNTAVKTISVLSTPTIVPNSSSPAVCLGNSVTLSGSGASTYTWTSGVTNNTAFAPGSTNTYTVTGTNICGTGSAAITVTVNPLPVVFIIASSPSICAGNSVSFSAGGALTYTWTGGVINGGAFSPLGTNTYTVSGSNINGCVNTAAQTITVNPLPVLGATASNTFVCAGSSITLNGTGANSYTWTGGISNGVAFVPGSSATYSVSGTNTLTGCTSSLSAFKTITVNPIPIIGANINTLSVCQGNTVVLNGTGATNYTWTGGISNGVPFFPSSSGSYSVTGTNTLTGCSATNNAVVSLTLNNLPVVTIAPSNTVICAGNSVTLTAGGASTYTWSGGISNGVSFNPSATNSYSVTGTNSLTGCTSTNSAMQTISVNPLPSVSIVASNTAVCIGNTLSLSGSNANTYSWSNGISNGVPFSPNTSTTYIVTGTNTLSGCSNTATQLITVNALPTVTAVANSTLVCAGASITLNGSGANTYQWSGGVINGVAFSASATNAYSVIGTNTVTGCISLPAAVVLSVNPLPSLSLANSSQTVCKGGFAVLAATGASSYTWTNGVLNSTPFTPSVTSNYICTGSNSLTGCTNTVATTLSVIALPVLSITASPTVVCYGSPVILNAFGANSYTWSNAVVNGIAFTPTATASYSVIGTDASTGCKSSSVSVTVTVNPLPLVSIVSSSSLLCVGETVSLTAGGAATYTWNGGSNNPVIADNPTVTSTYSVLGRDNNGCANTSVFTQSVSECTGLYDAWNSQVSFQIYPNPSSGEFFISSELDMSISIFNETGEMVKSIVLDQNSREIVLSGLPNGVYVVMGLSGNARVIKKVIVAR